MVATLDFSVARLKKESSPEPHHLSGYEATQRAASIVSSFPIRKYRACAYQLMPQTPNQAPSQRRPAHRFLAGRCLSLIEIIRPAAVYPCVAAAGSS